MEKYIALLPGINISGKNKVSMPLLKLAFQDLGFLNVSTHINSENVLFSSAINDKIAMSGRRRAMIEERFMLDVPVAIISLNGLSEILDIAPEWWDINFEEEMTHQ